MILMWFFLYKTNDMKFSLFLMTTVLSIASFTLSAQTVNDIPIEEIDATYIELIISPEPFSTKFTVLVDFGQSSKVLSNKSQVIKNDQGESIVFNSVIDGLNFFDKLGYDLIEVYMVDVGDRKLHRFLLKKRVDE